MCIHWMKELVASEAVCAAQWSSSGRDLVNIRIASGVVGSSVAANNITPGVSKIRIVDSKLRVIKNVERFYSKFKDLRFSWAYREVLE